MKFTTLIISFFLLLNGLYANSNNNEPSNNFEKGHLIHYKTRSYQPYKNINDFKIDNFKKYIWKTNKAKESVYLLVQFNELPKIDEFERISEQIELLEYITNNSYFASIPKGLDIQLLKEMNIISIDSIRGVDKISPNLIGDLPKWMFINNNNSDIEVFVHYFSNIELNDAEKILKDFGQIQRHYRSFNKFSIIIDKAKIIEIAELPFVMWLEEGISPQVLENRPGLSSHRASYLQAPVSVGGRALTGEGVRIGIWDGGNIGNHIDFTNRVTQVQNTSYSDHATHCLGTAAGAGIRNPRGKGMSPQSLLFSWYFGGSVIVEAEDGITNHQINLSTNSYGSSSATSPYNTSARDLDVLVRNNPTFSHVHSAGNSGSNYGTITASGNAKSAKNNIVVGALDNLDVIASFSSRGPTSDGRLKPEVSAVGVNVFSTLNNHTYNGTYSGTSMATPGVAGTIALLYERYKQLNNNELPSSAVIRALISNTSDDLGNPGPDYTYGFGRINSRRAAIAMEDERFLEDLITQGDTNIYTNIIVPANALQVRAMITYIDKEGAVNASPSLVNNLNLSLLGPNNTTYLPLVLNPASPANMAVAGLDSINNIEQVIINNPPQGNYSIRVHGHSVPFGPQEYCVTWEIVQPEMQIIFPIGGEKFVPETSEIIRWDASGVSGNQTLEFSTNGGTSWETISSTISQDQRHFSWTPTANHISGQALFRISNGTMQSTSVSPISIMPTNEILGTYIDTNGVSIYYNSIASATSYRVFILSDGRFIPIGTTSDTTFTITGLNSGSYYWFSVCGVHSNGVEGEKSLGVEVMYPHPYLISGKITVNYGASVSGIRVTNGIDTVFVDNNGDYTISVDNGTYTITPISQFFTFTPTNRIVTINNSNSLNQNFTGYELPNITIGTDTLSNTSTGYPSPYGNFYFGARHQFLILATELNVAGLLPGDSLKGIAFDVSATNGTPIHQDFRVLLGNTAVTTLTGTETGLTEVSSPANHLPYVGWNVHQFDTPFVWNGNNLIVETCFQNSSYIVNASVRYSVMSGFTPTRFFRADASNVCTTNLSTSSQNRPNMKFLINDDEVITSSQLLSPTNNSTNILTNPTLLWSVSRITEYYRLQVSTDNNFSNLIYNDTTSSLSISMTGLQFSNTYYWRVKSYNSLDSSAWSAVWSFSIRPALLTPTLVSPADDSNVNQHYANLVWNNDIYATSYRVQVSAQSNFQNLLINAVGIADTVHYIPNLIPNSTYYWRVKSYNPTDSSQWSQVHSFTTNLSASITIGTGTISSTFPFYSYYMDADSYFLYRANEIIAAGGNSGQLTSISFNILTINSQLQALNGFKIFLQNTSLDAISAPVTSGWELVYSVTSFTPTNVGWNEFEFISPFDYDASKNLLVKVCFNNSTWTSNSTVQATTVANTTHCRFADLANDDGCTTLPASSTSPARPNIRLNSLTAISMNPPNLISPANSSTNIPATAILKWDLVPYSEGYFVQIATDDNFQNIVNSSTLADTIANVSLSYNSTYYWRVKSFNSLDTSDWSAIWSFTTEIGLITQNIPLSVGWNMISGYVAPQNLAMSAITSPIASQFTQVKNAAGQVYMPPFLLSLNIWNTEQAYLIYISNATTLPLTGLKITPESTPINISQTGWYWLPYYRTSGISPATALASIQGKYSQVKHINGQVFMPPFLNTLQMLMPHNGYMIYISQPAVLIYPANE